MTAHTCRTVTPGCYRCDLGYDEVTAMHAEDYFDANISPMYAASGFPPDAINNARGRYLSDCVKSPAVAAQLRAWSFGRDGDDPT